MITIERTNKKGMKFILSEVTPVTTEIVLKDNPDKSILVDHAAGKLNTSWFMWTTEGDSLWNSFHYLKPHERRFIDKGEL